MQYSYSAIISFMIFTEYLRGLLTKAYRLDIIAALSVLAEVLPADLQVQIAEETVTE